MTYGEYLTAADRHIVACECLLKCLDDTHTSKEDSEKLLAEVYYLTGYIAEGSINYGLYHLVVKKGLFQASPDVTKLNIDQGKKLSLTYSYHIEKHRFKDNLDILINLGENEFGKSTPAISQLTKLTGTIKNNRLFSKWTTNYRYVAPPHSEQEIRDFLNDYQKLKNIIQSLTKQGT